MEIEKLISEHSSEFSKLNTHQQEMFKQALGEKDFVENEKRWRELLLDINFPILEDPNAEMDGKKLTELQRAVALLCYYSDHKYVSLGSRRRKSDGSIQFALSQRESIPRWLGIKKQGLLEEKIQYIHNDKALNIPLWRALQLAEEERKYEVIFNTMPAKNRMDIIIELIEFYHEYGEDMYNIPFYFLLDDEVTDQMAGEYAGWAQSHVTMLAKKSIHAHDKEWVFLFKLLVKGNIKIKPGWEKYIPSYSLVNLIDYFPEERKEHLIKLLLPKFLFPHSITMGAIKLLEKYPCPTLIEAIAQNFKACRKPARIVLLEAMNAVPKESQWYEELNGSYKKLPKLQEFFVLSSVKPKEIEDIKKHHHKQVELSMNKWDGGNLSLSERFSHENEEVKAPGNITEIIELSDDKGKPVVDICIIGVDSGTVFEAGTTNEIGSIIHFDLKMNNKKLQESIACALFTRPIFKK